MTTTVRPAPRGSIWTEQIRVFDRIRPLDIADFARSLRTMINAGLPLNDALEKIAETIETESPKLATIVRQAHFNIERRGMELGDAFRPYSGELGFIFVELLDAGAKTGKLTDSALPAVVRIYSLLAKARSARITAAIYPVAVLFFSLVLTYVAANVVIPGIRPLFDLPGRHTDLPLVTKAVLAYADLWTSPTGLLAIAAVISALIAVAVVANRSQRIRPVKDRLKLRIPVYSKLWRAETFAETLAILGAMIGAGIPLHDALEISARTSPNWAIADALRRADVQIERNGLTLHEAIRQSDVFPPTVIAAIEVGEKSGALEMTTGTLSEHFFAVAAELRVRIERVTEYVLLAVMGIYVGLIVISTFLPVYQAIDNLSGR